MVFNPALAYNEITEHLIKAPLGVIVLWSGARTDIPDGWHICDGQDGTPEISIGGFDGSGNMVNPEIADLCYIMKMRDSTEDIDRAEAAAKAAEAAANRAQSEAERATVPAVEGVYNIILEDRVTGERWLLMMEDGRLSLLGVESDLDATELTLVDVKTGTAYTATVENGQLVMVPVPASA